MKRTFLVSDEMLNAFVDDELEGDDREHIIKLEEIHPEINRAINEKRRLKFLIKTARFQEQPISSTSVRQKCMSFSSKTIAASFILVLVFFTAYLMPDRNQLTPDSIVKYSPNSSYRNTTNLIQAFRANEVKKIIFHLNTADSNVSMKLLNDVEVLVIAAKQNGHRPNIEIIATGQGINILTTKTKESIVNIIESIQEQQSGVNFIVCGLSLNKLQHTENNRLVLLQKTMLVASGKKWIKQRKKQGWSYMVI
ncbi:hypothetical protein MNBD_GAMMA21-3047 [hydrothermal vent metagenome]|uniref:Uncharacterized protein n=1 Tax=hydrothermal vent metagenome TaxID=652676 RepID=A0A3B1AM13_9ZZZZ